MHMRAKALLGFILLGEVILPSGLRGDEAPTYRGFLIDDSRVHAMANLDPILTAIKEQIDIVCSVGVPAEMMTFFQSVPFEVVPPGIIAPGNPGLYSSTTKTVRITSIVVTAGHKPILLHELLHAYHDQKIPDGFDNSYIALFYERAKSIQSYAPKSHMMVNNKEFFACSGTAYLFGVTAQEPFNREKVKTNQPVFYDYLRRLFGPAAGEYHGSLTEPK
jgi:hypothetical protein